VSRRIITGLSALAILLGAGHLAVTMIMFDRLTFASLWFGGSGLAIMLGGVVNLFASLTAYGNGARALLGIANLATIGFFALALLVVPEPQVIFGLLLFGTLLALQQAPGARAAL
jgi:hypothetical protein